MRQHPRSARLLSSAALFALCISPVACGNNANDTTADVDNFSVNGNLIGTANTISPGGSCTFPNVKFSPGDQVVLRGADNTILATDQLKWDEEETTTDETFCSLTFKLDNVVAGEAAYQVTVGSAGDPIVVTEEQLRGDPTKFTLVAQDWMDKLGGKTEVLIAR